MMMLRKLAISSGSIESVKSSMPCALENPCPVAVRGQHVGEARQRVEPVPLAEVDGRLVAEAPVRLVGSLKYSSENGSNSTGVGSTVMSCSLTFGRGATVTDGIDRLAPPRSTASTTEISSSTSISEPLM